MSAHAGNEYATVRRLSIAGRTSARVAGIIALTALVSSAAACGGERTFEAAEFVEEANARGAGMELGEPLSSVETGSEVYAVELASSATQVHGGGSLVVAEDVERAQTEFARCESAASLICYRAANVVLRLEEVLPEQRTQLDDAFTELGSE